MIIAYWTLVALVAQTALIVLMIVRVKAGRRLKEAWHEEYYRRLRPALVGHYKANSLCNP